MAVNIVFDLTLYKSIYHMNVSPNGFVCLDVIKKGHGWTVAMTFKSVALSLVSLLDDPNPGEYETC